MIMIMRKKHSPLLHFAHGEYGAPTGRFQYRLSMMSARATSSSWWMSCGGDGGKDTTSKLVGGGERATPKLMRQLPE